MAERVPGASDRVFQPEDCCGFWIDTPDGTIWAPGDSRLIPDHHLRMPPADAMLFDFSDSEWHFGLDGAVTMANAYPLTPLLLYHWGSVDAPDFRCSTPTRAHCRTGWKIRNAFRYWRPASHSCCGDCKADQAASKSPMTPFVKRSVVLIPSPGQPEEPANVCPFVPSLETPAPAMRRMR